ncbi:MAG: ATP-dependent DNA helicase [Synergistaceae bacterium]|jgi:ATP-dependent DNA helicase DinG|nr:ATP-dependent DNA helicase [Synergistaceae bacterium]
MKNKKNGTGGSITRKSFEKFFAPSGPLARRLEGYEHRPQQLAFARAVRDFLLNPGQLIMAAEAPPGVGKTFAVLAPALLESGDNHILFLTASIALQEQVIGKDLPKLNDLLGKSFSYGLLKGRGNYACLRSAAAAPNAYLLPLAGATPLDLPRWLEETETGDLSELALPAGHPLAAQISANARGCLGNGCPFRGRCFVAQTYRRAQDWKVIVANYHLFFSHILTKGSFPIRYEWLVCDEAHRMADAARNAAMVEADAENGASLLRSRVLSGFDKLLNRNSVDTSLFKKKAESCREMLSTLFDLVGLKYRQSEGIAERSEELFHKGEELGSELDKLLAPLREIEERFASGGFENAPDLGEAAAVVRWIEEVKDYKRALGWCLSVENFPNWGYWRSAAALVSAPVVCGAIVQDALAVKTPEKSLMVSATLSIEGDFSFWSRETGITPDVTFMASSPFDFQNQMELLIVDVGIPVASEGYDARVCRVVEKLCEENGGRTLVLLSSMRLLRSLAEHMRRRQREYEVLVQGELPQRELLRRFREDETSVLLGSVSFREGVDVPGNGLTQVIVDRIPFPHPNDPLVQARNALEGQKVFVRTTLPNAKMFLRQAVGRLIRSGTDQGRVALLDGRALDRKDWKILESLPPCKYRRLIVKG